MNSPASGFETEAPALNPGKNAIKKTRTPPKRLKLKTGRRGPLVAGRWLLAAGSWLLAAGRWVFGSGYALFEPVTSRLPALFLKAVSNEKLYNFLGLKLNLPDKSIQELAASDQLYAARNQEPVIYSRVPI